MSKWAPSSTTVDNTSEKQDETVLVTDADSRQDHTVLSASGAEVSSLSFAGGSTDLIKEIV